MFKNANRWIALSVLMALMLSTLGTALVAPAQAGSTGRRNTAIGLGAVTAYGLLTHRRTVAVAGALGTAYAYKRYRDSKNAENRRRYHRYHHYHHYRR